MNERGETTLFAILALVTLTGVLLLCSLELLRNYRLLETRSKLFLCVKETKGELNDHLKLMGRTNWALKNTLKLQIVMIFIPGLQGVAANAEHAKRFLRAFQDINLLLYLARLSDLARRGCKPDPRMFLTPFKISPQGHTRAADGTALLRSSKWTYHFFHPPYALSLEASTLDLETIYPRIRYRAKELGGKLSSRLSTAF